MTIPGVNERMALLIKLLKDDPERLLMVKEVESRFSISNFTARSDLKALVQLGLLNAIQVNKKKQSFIRSNNFETVLKKLSVNKL